MSAASAVLGLLAVFVLTAGTGYFVAQEFAYVSADRLALARDAAAGDRRAARALTVLERLSFMLSGAQLGITVTGLIVGFIAEPSVSALLEPALTGIGVPEGAVGGISVVLAFTAATVVQMVLGELAPKNLALAVPERLAKSLAPPTGCCAGWASSLSRNCTTARPWRSWATSSASPTSRANCPRTPPNCSTTPWSSPSAPSTR
jgi:CBS domain containing-hemolysin-like protein